MRRIPVKSRGRYRLQVTRARTDHYPGARQPASRLKFHQVTVRGYVRNEADLPMVIGYGVTRKEFAMAFILCDDHNLSVEADGMDPAAARRWTSSCRRP